jgi:hypothetical protein
MSERSEIRLIEQLKKPAADAPAAAVYFVAAEFTRGMPGRLER